MPEASDAPDAPYSTEVPAEDLVHPESLAVRQVPVAARRGWPVVARAAAADASDSCSRSRSSPRRRSRSPTAMPIVARDLGGLELYGLVFSAFLVGSLVGIVVAGSLIDRRGVAPPVRARARLVRDRADARGRGHVDADAHRRPAHPGHRRRRDPADRIRRDRAQPPGAPPTADVRDPVDGLDPAGSPRARRSPGSSRRPSTGGGSSSASCRSSPSPGRWPTAGCAGWSASHPSNGADTTPGDAGGTTTSRIRDGLIVSVGVHDS